MWKRRMNIVFIIEELAPFDPLLQSGTVFLALPLPLNVFRVDVRLFQSNFMEKRRHTALEESNVQFSSSSSVD